MPHWKAGLPIEAARKMAILVGGASGKVSALARATAETSSVHVQRYWSDIPNPAPAGPARSLADIPVFSPSIWTVSEMTKLAGAVGGDLPSVAAFNTFDAVYV